MDAEGIRKGELRPAGIRELHIALEPDMEFDEIVSVLREALTIPLPRGCEPCLSGLDRLAIDSTIFEQIQQRRLLG